VYRHDSDATHYPMFHQIEAFCVGEDVTFALEGRSIESPDAKISNLFHKIRAKEIDKQSEEDGEETYLIERWQPLEISVATR